MPSAGRARLRLNLWLNNAAAPPLQPAGGQPVEVVVRDVVYLPEPDAGILLGSGLLLLTVLKRWRTRSSLSA